MAYMRDANGVRLDSIGVVPQGLGPAVQIAPLPTLLSGLYNWNGAAFYWDQICTVNGVQYAVLTNTSRQPWIIMRTLGSGGNPTSGWTAFNLSTVAGISAPIGQDFHLGIRVWVDPAGYVHVAGNFHDSPWVHIYSTTPGEITTWTNLGTGMPTNSTSSSYPTFFTINGVGKCWYRDGASGNGDLWMNQQTAAPGTWASMGKIIDGMGSGQSPYWNRPVVDASGVLHLSWCWRLTGNPDGNNNISYAKSADGGVTWTDSHGNPYTLPINSTTAQVISTIPTGSGLLNSQGATIDSAGRYQWGYFKLDGNSCTQYWRGYLDSSGNAHNEQITTTLTRDYSTAGVAGVVSFDVARPALVSSKEGRTYMIWRSQFDGRRGTIRCTDVTPGLTYFPEGVLAEIDLHEWEPIFDSNAARDRDELHMLMCPLKQSGLSEMQIAGGNEIFTESDATAWSSQVGFIATYDLSRMPEILSQKSRIPRIQRVTGGYPQVQGGVTVSGTTLADIAAGGYALINPQDTRKGLLVARARVRAKVLTGTQTVTLTTALVEGTAYITLVGNVTGAIGSGVPITLNTVPGTPNTGQRQTFVTTSSVASGSAVSIPVTSNIANFSFPVGTVATSGGLYVALRENDETAGTNAVLATMSFYGGNQQSQMTPWIPLTLLGPSSGDFGWVNLWAYCNTGYTGQISMASVETAEFVC